MAYGFIDLNLWRRMHTENWGILIKLKLYYKGTMIVCNVNNEAEMNQSSTVNFMITCL